MRIDKEKAIELRREGKSYKEIHIALGVPMATLSAWFGGMEWSKNLHQNLIRDGQKSRVARLHELNSVRGERLKKSYQKAREEAHKELSGLRHDPLFVAGMMLYWADGDRTSKGQVRLSTSDMDKAKFYLTFLTKACGVAPEKVRASLMVYPGQDEASNRRFWAFALGLGVKFTKGVQVPGRHNAQKLTYGICVLTVSSTYFKVKMLEWLTLLPKRLIEGR